MYCEPRVPVVDENESLYETVRESREIERPVKRYKIISDDGGEAFNGET